MTARIRATIEREIERRQGDMRAQMEKIKQLQREVETQQKALAVYERSVSESRLALEDFVAAEKLAKEAETQVGP